MQNSGGTENKKLDEKNVRYNYPARLQLLAKSWKDKWDGPLSHSQKLVNLWASGYYSKGYSRWHLINLMNRGISTIVSYLVEGNPQVMIKPISPRLKIFAHTMKLIMNHLINKYNFAENVLIPGATASMFGAGITRIFYEYDRRVSIDNEKIKVGTPKVVIISPCDYIGDPSAKYRHDFSIEGDTYRLPTEYAKDLFAKKDKFGNQIADYIESDCKLVSKYSNEELATKDSFDFNKLALEEYTTFHDIYNYKSGTIDTIMPMGHKAKILKSIEWKGPGSPYDYLGYKYAPEVPVPLPPAWDWYDLDVTMNIMAKAAREQAESQKNVIGSEPGGEKAAKAVINSKNMDVLSVKGMDQVKQFSFGGVNADNYSWMNWAESQFTKSGTASSDVMGGRGASAPTLGQEQLIFANATRLINNFYNRYHGWETSILRKFMWAIIDDPTAYVEVLDTVQLPGIGEYEYPVFYSKADKVADFYDLTLDVVPYSSQRQSPEQMYQRLFQFMTTWILPTMQMRQQQGSTIDLSVVDSLLAEYGGFDEFPAWYKSVVPQIENPNVDFIMKSDSGKGPKNFGQQNDSQGASGPSKTANMQAQQNKAGYAGETK